MTQTDLLFAIRFALHLALFIYFGRVFVAGLPTAIRERNGSVALSALSLSLSLFMLATAGISLLNLLWPDGREVWLEPILWAIDLPLAAAVGVSIWLHVRGWQSAKIAAYFSLLRTPDREIIRRLQEEEEKNTALQRLVLDQEHFVYAAAHDLRAPLRAIRGFVDLVVEEGDQPPNPDYLHHINAGTDKILGLIDALASYSKVKAGHALDVVDLNEVVKEVLADFELVIAEKGADVRVGRLPAVKGSPAKLYLVVQNLIDNALKFGAGRVSISADKLDGRLVITVADNGIGIDPAYHDKIFGIFQRLNREEEYPGAGMGLAICRKIITQHGGRLWVESQAGRGAAFRFSLPAEGS
jgi:signal transduction histidine kinase